MRHNPSDRDEASAVLLHSERWTVVQGAMPGAAAGRPRVPSARRAWSQANAHRIANPEILLAVRGEDWFGMDGAMYPCRPGCLFLIAPGVPHDLNYPESASGLEHIWLRVLSDRVFVNWVSIEGGRQTRLHESLAVLHQEEVGVLTAPFSDLARDSGYASIRLRLLVGMIASHLAEHAASPQAHPAAATPPPASVQSNVAAAIRRHIDDTAGRGVTLESLAHFSGYSKFHLSRVFRTWSGCSVHQYIDRARQRKAEALRADGARNSDIADALGFSETAAYLRWRRIRRR